MTMNESSVSRRTFVKGSLAGLALAGAAGSTALYGCAPKDEKGAASEGAGASTDQISWSQCNVNCGGNCVFQWHSQDGKIVYMESDNTGDVDLQARACLRGRSMRRWINSPDRLTKPMKRVGKRGEGKFEEISWDEAIDTIASELKRVIDTYGNEAIYVNYATGMYSTTGKQPGLRLLGLLGGYINQAYDYSTHMLQVALPFMYGSKCSPYDNVHASSFSEAERASDLVVMFGNSPAETRMGGANAVWDFAKVRESVTGRGGKIVNIDYRMNESCSGHPDEWLPIRPGTDAALASAIAHEWIANDQVDKGFLDEYCVGYDEDTMPESAKGQSKSYKDYIMGTGYDMVEKTPEWAAPICGISADRIKELAAEIGAAKPLYVVQGWGPQRRSNGELNCWSIMMLPLLTGQVGLPGTSNGCREGSYSISLQSLPAGDNPIKAKIPVFLFTEAIDHGTEMTALNSAVTGADKLNQNIKCMLNYAGNCLTNQHGDINYAHDILADESKCEFIVVWETAMTDSAKYADILLPDLFRFEQVSQIGTGGDNAYMISGQPCTTPKFERKTLYDALTLIADKMGVKEQFTEGKTQEDWIKELYEAGAKADGNMPTWDEIKEQGVYKRPLEPAIGLGDFRTDPVKNPLSTPSGKIEIYSEQLAEIAATWELEEGDVINPIPVFTPGFQGYGSVTDEYPLYCTGFHHKSRTHSSFGFIPELEQVARQQLWINPADAESRGIASGDTVAVKSPAGEIRIEALVTPRIIPGTIGIPQGAWHKADMNGDRVDEGACVNTLTTYRPTPLAKGNGPAHSIIAQITKA